MDAVCEWRFSRRQPVTPAAGERRTTRRRGLGSRQISQMQTAIGPRPNGKKISGHDSSSIEVDTWLPGQSEATQMNRIDSAMNQLGPAQVSAAVSTTPLDVIVEDLEKLNISPTSTAGYRVRRKARIQAVHWLNRLDTADRPDELWPAFEDWLACPENRYQYWAAERTRRALDELGGWCPREGSAEAEQLLRLSTVPPQHWGSHIASLAKWVFVSTSFVASLAAMYLTFR